MRYDRISGFNNNTSKRILDELEAVYLRLRKIKVEGVAVIKFRVNNGGGDGTSCFEIKKIADEKIAVIWLESAVTTALAK